MIYVTNANWNLLVYHIYRTYGKKPITIKDATENDILKAISTMGEIGLESVEDYICLLEYKYSSIPNLSNHSLFNSTYIHITSGTHNWDGCNTLILDPNLYKPPALIMKGLFTEEGADYFWQELCLKRFKCNPFKWYTEINSLIVNKKEAYTLNHLKELYEIKASNTLVKFLIKLGTTEAFDILEKVTDCDLWIMLMGAEFKKPYIYHYLVDKNNAQDVYACVTLFQQLIYDSLIDVRRACYLLNYWFILHPLERGYKYIKLSNPVCIKELEEFLYV